MKFEVRALPDKLINDGSETTGTLPGSSHSAAKPDGKGIEIAIEIAIGIDWTRNRVRDFDPDSDRDFDPDFDFDGGGKEP